jgi:BlaI family transcriptional regulator, penicillinase repressor
MNKRLLDSEWAILKTLWGKPPQTLKKIVEGVQNLQPDINWNYKTYHTYLRIMQEKCLIGSEIKNGKDKLYFPLISQEDALITEGENLVNRISLNSVGRLVALLAGNEGLSDQEQQELLDFASRLEKGGDEK